MNERLFQDEWLIKALSVIPAVTPGDVSRIRLQGASHLCAALMGEGLLTREELCRAVLQTYGVESVDPGAGEVERFVLRLVPEKVCRQRELLPLRLIGGTGQNSSSLPPVSGDEAIALAMADPLDTEAQSEVRALSGRRPKAYFCPRDQVLRLIDGLYAAVAARPPAAAGPRRVLIADDDKDIRAIARLLLKAQGCQVEEAPDGEAALRAVAAQPPDLLLLDLNMPGLDGLAVLKALRSSPAGLALPVIMLTAASDRKIQEEAIGLGAEDYLVKPFKPALLAARVNSVFKRLAY